MPAERSGHRGPIAADVGGDLRWRPPRIKTSTKPVDVVELAVAGLLRRTGGDGKTLHRLSDCGP